MQMTYEKGITSNPNITFQQVRLLQLFKHDRKAAFTSDNLPELKTLKQHGLVTWMWGIADLGYITPLGERVLERAKQVGLNDYIYGVKFPFP